MSGILFTQAILYWPSLTGQRILLPTEVLSVRGIYAPEFQAPPPGPRGTLLSDLVVQLEPLRVFAAAEVRAGRMPLWNPYLYCGSPLLAAGQAGALSPFQSIRCLFPSPRAIVFIHLALALFAGFGAYAFFRQGCASRSGPRGSVA